MLARRVLVRVLVIVGMVAVLAAAVPDPRDDHPPHVRPAAMGGAIGNEAADAVAAGDLVAWLEGVDRAEWYRGVQEELDRQAAEEAAALVAQSRARSTTGVPRSGAPASCAGVAWVVPVDIVIGESGCSFDAYNATGCGGYGCVGAYQFDTRHFGSWGGCADLNPALPEDQHECARRLSSDGANLAPWGR